MAGGRRASPSLQRTEAVVSFLCYCWPSLASSSARRVSSASSLARVLASTCAWTSNSSRVTRSSLAKPWVIIDFTFFSMSLAGEFSIAWLILFCISLKKVFMSIVVLDVDDNTLHYYSAYLPDDGANSFQCYNFF